MCFFLQVRQESRPELLKKYKKVTPEEAEDSWTTQYNASEKVIGTNIAVRPPKLSKNGIRHHSICC